MLIIDGLQYSNWDRTVFEQMRKGGIEAVVGTAEDIPYEDNRFPYACCLNTLAHLDNPVAAMLDSPCCVLGSFTRWLRSQPVSLSRLQR